jgi:hypothetical protein
MDVCKQASKSAGEIILLHVRFEEAGWIKAGDW